MDITVITQLFQIGFRCSKISEFVQSMSKSNQMLTFEISGTPGGKKALKEILVRFGCGKNKVCVYVSVNIDIPLLLIIPS